MDSLLDFLSSTATGVVIAAVTLFLGWQRLPGERWWEYRFKCYEALLESVYELKRAFAEEVANDASGSFDHQGAQRGRLTELTERLDRQISLSGFRVSEKSRNIVIEFLTEINKPIQNKHELSRHCVAAGEHTLRSLIAEAHSDLRLRPWRSRKPPRTRGNKQ